MGWLNIVMLLIKFGPAIISMVNEIYELIRKLQSSGAKDEAAFAQAALSNAVSEYKKTGDRRLIRALRTRLRERCDGV